MILVDSSVWIEYFGPGKTPVCDQLEDLISDGQIIAVTGVIIQEVLQGTHSEQQMMQLKNLLGINTLLHPADPVETYVAAADIYRRCRKAGITPRSSIDCLIVQIALESEAGLLHADRDYLRIAQVVPDLILL